MTNSHSRTAITYFGRILGPVSGFLVGSYTSNIYVDLANQPTDLTPRDPQWIGAWHLGFMLTSVMQLLCGVLFLVGRIWQDFILH